MDVVSKLQEKSSSPMAAMNEFVEDVGEIAAVGPRLQFERVESVRRFSVPISVGSR
jgi:hypothetical protein